MEEEELAERSSHGHLGDGKRQGGFIQFLLCPSRAGRDACGVVGWGGLASVGASGMKAFWAMAQGYVVLEAQKRFWRS